MIVKEVKLMALSRGLRLHQYMDDWLIRSQSQEEAQVNTQEVVDLTQSLGWKINQEKSELKLTQVFSFVGYEHHLDSALVKPTQERWLKLQDLILCLKSKHVLTARCLMSLIGLLASTEKMVPGGTPSHEALSVSPQGALDISSVAGQPPSLDRNHFSTPRLVARSLKRDERRRPSSQRPQHPTLYRRLKRRLGCSLRSKFYQGSVVRLGKIAVSLALRSFKDQCQNQTVLVATDNSTVVAYINKQGGTNSAEMCALLWKIMTWCHHYHIRSKARHIPGCLNVMADLLSRSKPSAVNRMVTASAVRVSSPRPKCLGHRCSELKLDGSHCLHLPSDGSPSQGDPKNQAMPLPGHRNSPRLARDALVLGPSAALNRDPTATSSVNNSSQTVPQLCVSQQSTASQPPRLVSRSGQLQEQGFSVEVAETIAAPI